MAEGPVNGSGSTVDIERTFSLRKLYIKDFSFEAPNSPAFFFEQHQPEMNLNIRTAHSDLGNGSLEVVLHMTAQSVIGERTVFLIEIAQAGMFQISGFNKEETRTIIGVHCPNALYPYAREAISSMVQRGGYPPLVLQPMDFAALFAQASQDTAAAQASQGLTVASSGVTSGTDTSDIAVFGAGSWGTALAVQFARAGHQVTLWGRNAAELRKLDEQRCNARYLPGIAFPEKLHPDPDLHAVIRKHQDLLICVPSNGFREILLAIRPHLQPGARIAWATKGFEHDSGQLPHQVVREVLGGAIPVAVLSGPTFASEVGAGLPTAMTIAASAPGFAAELAVRLSGLNFRAYTSDDMVGVEVGGAVKNVLAIAAGISDGLGFGANTRIALITRGLLEMTRLGAALGAQPATFMGLSGMGDLVLSCTDDQSRNRRLGLMVAAGKSPAEAATAIGQVVEGLFAAVSVRTVAARLGLEMPICEQVYQVLHERQPARDAVMALMARSLKPETDMELRNLFSRSANTLPLD